MQLLVTILYSVHSKHRETREPIMNFVNQYNNNDGDNRSGMLFENL